MPKQPKVKQYASPPSHRPAWKIIVVDKIDDCKSCGNGVSMLTQCQTTANASPPWMWEEGAL